jgi:BirA family biotin operon repressor/biotin-[acetyl-CoA-carboxylase] ligase
MEFLNAENPFGAPVYRFGSVSSTMDEAKRLAAAGCRNGTVAVADVQEAGRGRIPGRVWRSEPGESLLCTTVLRFPSLREMPAALTLRVGLAAAAAIERTAPFPPGSVQVKWPNDVLAVQTGTLPSRGKKLCGILCESDGSAVYVGTGFNLAQRAFAPEIREKATSILLETRAETTREALLEAFLSELDSVLRIRGGEWKDRLESRLFRRGESVRFETGAADSGAVVSGTLVGIGPGGEALIAVEGEPVPRAFVSGELRVYD